MSIKESKNSGITKSCPVCKKTAFRGLKFFGESQEETIRCPHCQSNLFRQISKKTVVKLTKITLCLLLIAIISMYSKSVIARKNPNCKMFSNHFDAQRTFDSDPKKYRNLDKNNNGVACESLLK